MRPNTSLERTRNGKAPWPCNAFVYDAPHGQGALPLRVVSDRRNAESLLPGGHGALTVIDAMKPPRVR